MKPESYHRVLLALLGLLITARLNSQTVSIVAGARPALTKGGTIAPQTPLGAVSAIAIDHSGTVYFADSTQSLVMKVAPDGTLTVIGGDGSGFSGEPKGDGGPAINAPIAAGFPIALDAAGNLFLVDYSRIREITMDGIIHTVLNGEQQLPPAIGSNDPSQWNGFLTGLTVDPMGRVFFAEMPGARVWRLDPDGTLTTIAGNGTYGPPSGDGGPAVDASLDEPQGIALDSAGNVYIADGNGGLIRKVSASDGTISTFAGGGDLDFRFTSPIAATNASLYDLASLAFDPQGNLCFFSLTVDLACISPSGLLTTIPTVEGGFGGDGGPSAQAQFQGSDAYTAQFAIDDAGNIFLPDGGNGRIRKIDPSGIVSTFAGNGNYWFAGDGGPAANALLRSPDYVSFGPAGELYVTDSGNFRIRVITPDGIIQTIAGNGETYLPGASPPTGIPAVSSPLDSDLYAATGIAGDAFYFSESFSLRRVDSSGIVSTVAGNGSSLLNFAFSESEGLAMGADGRLYFTDGGAILRLNPEQTYTTIVGQVSPVDSVGIGSPRGLAFGYPSYPQTAFDPGTSRDQFDSVPRNGNLPVPIQRWPRAPIYFADVSNGRVLEVDPYGRLIWIAGNGQVGFSGDGGPAVNASFFYPQAVTVDPSGFVYVADWGNGCVRRISPDGIISTLPVGLSYPSGLALDKNGTLYIADRGNNRIVAVTDPQK